ncbi:ribosomal maturation YjgA family protein [Micromonospora arborensis]|uniref:ribosomal maturation YjgA family protein n=1 Tax=Micromonospora arborensis TaxID=2116518 RepID=UPI0037130FD8
MATIARTPITARTVRLLMPVAALLFLGLALLIRAVDDGALRQYSGTALYASMVWAAVLFLWPRMTPLPAGAVATAFCWLVELAQLTGVPADLSARSLAARLALGVQFDPVDLAWYPVGVAPLLVLHHLVRARHRRTLAVWVENPDDVRRTVTSFLTHDNRETLSRVHREPSGPQ